MDATPATPADDGRTDKRLRALTAAFRRLTPGQQNNFVAVAQAWADETNVDGAGPKDVALIHGVLKMGLDLMDDPDEDALNAYLIANRHPLDLLKMHALDQWEDLKDRVTRIRAGLNGEGDEDGAESA